MLEHGWRFWVHHGLNLLGFSPLVLINFSLAKTRRLSKLRLIVLLILMLESMARLPVAEDTKTKSWLYYSSQVCYTAIVDLVGFRNQCFCRAREQ